MSEDCIFCGIVAGDIPSTDLYEDDQVLAFLDVNPVAEGHALVIPKAHHERVTDFDTETTAAVFDAARQIARALDASLEPDGFNLFQSNGEAAGQEVFHAHVHVVPRHEDDEIRFDFPRADLDEETASRVQSAVQAEL